MITKDKITEIFCIANDFCKEFDVEIAKLGVSRKTQLHPSPPHAHSFISL